MMQVRTRHMRRLYHDWKTRALACKTRDGWICLHCGVRQFSVRYSASGHPYIIYLHAAHVHPDDVRYPDRDLITLCIRCHARYDVNARARAARVRIERLKHRRYLGTWYAQVTARVIAVCLVCL